MPIPFVRLMGLCISILHLPDSSLNTTNQTVLVVEEKGNDFDLMALEFSKFLIPENFLQEKDWEDKTTKPYSEPSIIWSGDATKSHRKLRVRCRDPTVVEAQAHKKAARKLSR